MIIDNATLGFLVISAGTKKPKRFLVPSFAGVEKPKWFLTPSVFFQRKNTAGEGFRTLADTKPHGI